MANHAQIATIAPSRFIFRPLFTARLFPIHVVADPQGNLWFRAKEVCAVLGYANVAQALKAHGRDIENQAIVHLPVFIDEGNLDHLIRQSTHAAAEPFKAWIQSLSASCKCRLKSSAYADPALSDSERNISRIFRACSGLASSSKTAFAAAQAKSRVSVTLTAASRMVEGIWFPQISSFLSNGLSAFMGLSPVVKNRLILSSWGFLRRISGRNRSKSSASEAPPNTAGTLVYGPQGCGKTLNAARIMAALDCPGLLEEWSPGDPIPPGTLAMTNVAPEEMAVPHGVRVLSFQEAMEIVEGVRHG